MPVSQKITALSSVTAGALLLISGIAAVGFYLYSVIDVQDQADQSVIYWYLIFLMAGIMLVSSGIYFLWIGFKSGKSESYNRLAKYSLVGLTAIAFLFILFVTMRGWTEEKSWEERVQQNEAEMALAHRMHRIEQIEIDRFDDEGFSYSVQFSEGDRGPYLLQTLIEDGEALFMNEAEEVVFVGSEREIIRFVDFDKLFEACFNESEASKSYVCVGGTGATTIFTLEVRLSLIKVKQQELDQEMRSAGLVSSGRIQFMMDTVTENMEVKVKVLQPVD